MENKDNQREMIYMAALLHDIGKFYQRADDKTDGKFNFLKAGYWEQPEIFCPSYKNSYSHKHVLWTAQFIEEQKEIFNKMYMGAFEGEDSLMRLAAMHHKPETIFQKIVQKADWYSSAVDRSDDQAGIDDGLEENQWDNFKKRRMVSVFETINRSEIEKYEYGIPVKELSLDRAFFPKKYDLFTEKPDYKQLWKGFVNEFEKLPSKNIHVFHESLLFLLEKYTVTIPSSTNHLPDVSLYDHAKTTAAFAVSIYDYLKEKNQFTEFINNDGQRPVRLIGADISGIQKFIYDIVSKNAAKNLKGRSFYLQLMVDSILKYIMDKLDLFSASVVYSSGGGFYIIAPNTKNITDKLKKIEQQISNKLFEKHKTSLYVAIDSIELQDSVLLSKGGENEIGNEWQRLIEKLNLKKRQKHLSQIANNYPDFFEPIEQGGESKNNRDAITGEELDDKDKVKFEDGFISGVTEDQIRLGKDLKDTKHWIITKYDAGKLLKSAKGYHPLGLGYYHYFLSEEKFSELSSIPDEALVININEPDFLYEKYKSGNFASGFKFYGGNSYPVDEKDYPLSFDKLVGEGEFKRLGVLRMDVDNLGQIFMTGFEEKKRTFSRYSTLSRSLDYFFKGYLNKIQEKYDQVTYILYAGGDDLFILGKWDELINLAEDIRNSFAEWTCHNVNMSISGGIAIVTPKFPIMKAADQAAEEEENAKNYKNKDQEKNAFSLMGYALSWQKGMEFEVVKSLKNEFLEYLNSGNPKSLIGFISGFHEKWKYQSLNNKNESWQWQMAYQLARFAKSIKDKKAERLVDDIKIDVFTNTYKGVEHNFRYPFIEILNLAARWAELEYRTNK